MHSSVGNNVKQTGFISLSDANILEHVGERETLIFGCVITADVLRFDSWRNSHSQSEKEYIPLMPPNTELVHQKEERKEVEEEETKEQETTDCTEDKYCSKGQLLDHDPCTMCVCDVMCKKALFIINIDHSYVDSCIVVCCN